MNKETINLSNGETKTANLYKVNLKGMKDVYIDVEYGVSYVVASNAESAYQTVRKSLEDGDIGFPKDRACDYIELLAEGCTHPNCGNILYIAEE